MMPEFHQRGSSFEVEFDAKIRVDLMDVVVDLDEFSEILGIEILGLLSTHPGVVNSEFDSVSVDADADAVYVRVKAGRSLDQFVTIAAIAFDSLGRLAAIKFELES